jgi:insertion element IS1 protein InsB
MRNLLSCPQCRLSHIKRNGHTHYRKQNYQCLNCGRQFVADSQHINQEDRAMIKRLLLERLSLLGICRVMGISLRWLLSFIAEVYDALPDDLNLCLPGQANPQVQILRLQTGADEMWSFVGRKQNKQWVWMAIDVESRQVIAFYVGDRSRKSARKLWNRIPSIYRQQASFDTDDRQAYKGVIAEAQHRVCTKGSGRTNIIERFNCTLRQRVSRLARETLWFSKSLSNHIGAIKYFICHYNQMLTASITFHDYPPLFYLL